MIKENDRVVLTVDFPREGLVAGDIGRVLYVHDCGTSYEVDIVTLDGEPISLMTLFANQVRLAARREIATVRQFTDPPPNVGWRRKVL